MMIYLQQELLFFKIVKVCTFLCINELNLGTQNGNIEPKKLRTLLKEATKDELAESSDSDDEEFDEFDRIPGEELKDGWSAARGSSNNL